MRTIRISRTVTASPSDPHGNSIPSARVLEAALTFGLGLDDARPFVIVPPTDVHLPHAGIIFITGPSGSGKSTILNLVVEQLHLTHTPVIDAASLQEPLDAPIIDQLGRDFLSASSLLSTVGLGDAFIMLRRPHELSDGQRARFNLARLIEHAESQSAPAVICIDEFAATLDRLTARTIAASIRRWISRTSHTLIVATTHDDLLEPLAPDILIHKHLGDRIEVHARPVPFQPRGSA